MPLSLEEALGFGCWIVGMILQLPLHLPWWLFPHTYRRHAVPRIRCLKGELLSDRIIIIVEETRFGNAFEQDGFILGEFMISVH